MNNDHQFLTYGDNWAVKFGPIWKAGYPTGATISFKEIYGLTLIQKG